MPKIWSQTIEAHHRDVREAILETTASLMAEHAPRAVTMSQIADEAGIGRATLYKYFPDLDAILIAWHERHVRSHLEHMSELREGAGDPLWRLRAVLEHYARVQYQAGHTSLTALLHRDEHVIDAQQQLTDIIRDLLVQGVKAGKVPADVATEELAEYCLCALAAAGKAQCEAAIDRLVTVVLRGLGIG